MGSLTKRIAFWHRARPWELLLLSLLAVSMVVLAPLKPGFSQTALVQNPPVAVSLSQTAATPYPPQTP